MPTTSVTIPPYNSTDCLNSIKSLQKTLVFQKDTFEASKVTFAVIGVFSVLNVGVGFSLIAIGGVPFVLASGMGVIPVFMGVAAIFIGGTAFVITIVMSVIAYVRSIKLNAVIREKLLLEIELFVDNRKNALPNPNDKLDFINQFNSKYPLKNNLDYYLSGDDIDQVFQNLEWNDEQVKAEVYALLKASKFPLSD